MEKNNRNIQFHFYATEQEAEMINERRGPAASAICLRIFAKWLLMAITFR